MQRRLPPAVRGDAARQARAARRSRSRRSQRFDAGELDARRRSSAAGLRARRAPRRATPRASSTTCARCRARRWRCSCASSRSGERKGQRKVSLRATDDDVDVSVDRPRAGRRRPPPRGRLLHDARARRADRVPARRDRRAARTRTPAAPALACARRSPEGRHREPPADGRRAADRQARRHDLARRGRRAVRRALGGVKTGHAGTLDPFATGLLLVLVGRATQSAARSSWRCPSATRRVAQLGALSSTGDPEGEITRTGRVPPEPPALPDRRDPPAPAASTRRSRSAASAPTGARAAARASRCPSGSSRCTRFERALARRAADSTRGRRRGPASRSNARLGHLRALADRRPGDAYCLELRRTAIGPFDVARRRARRRRAGSPGAIPPADRARSERPRATPARARRAAIGFVRP